MASQCGVRRDAAGTVFRFQWKGKGGGGASRGLAVQTALSTIVGPELVVGVYLDKNPTPPATARNGKGRIEAEQR